MADYITDHNARAKAEEKIIYQLGNIDMVNDYNSGKIVIEKGEKIIKIVALISFAVMFFNVWTNKSGLLAIIAGIIFVLSIFSGIAIQIISESKKSGSVSLSPDLAVLSRSKGKEKLKIDEYGVSYTYLISEGDEDSPDTYGRKTISREDITEILRCRDLGLFMFCGNTSEYVAGGNALSPHFNETAWRQYNSMNALSLRVYEYWTNKTSGVSDLENTIRSSFGVPVREVNKEEAMEVIRKDELLKISSYKNRFLK